MHPQYFTNHEVDTAYSLMYCTSSILASLTSQGMYVPCPWYCIKVTWMQARVRWYPYHRRY